MLQCFNATIWYANERLFNAPFVRLEPEIVDSCFRSSQFGGWREI